MSDYRKRQFRPDDVSIAPPERRSSDEEISGDENVPNPPRTTKGGITAPKFGSAGSGGAELEPGLDKN